MDHSRRSALERLLRGNPRKPALLGKLLVRRKIEPHQQSHFAVRGGFRFCCCLLCRCWFAGFFPCFGGRLSRGFFFRFSRRSRFFRRRWFLGGLSRSASALRPVHFVLHPFVQPERLPPPVELVPRLLGLFLVRPKIEPNINPVRMSHASSLRRGARQVKIRTFRAQACNIQRRRSSPRLIFRLARNSASACPSFSRPSTSPIAAYCSTTAS